MRSAPISLDLPVRDQLINEAGMATTKWESFFKLVERFLSPLGQEKAFALTNNQAVAADIEGLSFDFAKVSAVKVHYLIQRVTTSTGAAELIEHGTFHCVYKPTSNNWSIFKAWSPGPDDSGVVLTITSAGQVQYTSSNITGTASISKITWRAETLAAKHSSYSAVG